MIRGKIKSAGVILIISLLLNQFCYGSVNIKIPGFHPQKLHIKCGFIKNNYQGKPQFLAAITIYNHDNYAIPQSGWKIYFSLRYHGLLKSQDSAFIIKHIAGDLFFIEPNQVFKGLPAGQSVAVKYTGNGIMANYQDCPSGIFWVNERDKEHTIALTSVSYDPVSSEGTIPYTDPKTIYDENSMLTDLPKEKLPQVLPQPASYKIAAGHFVLDKGVEIVSYPAFKNESVYLASTLKQLTGRSPSPAHKQKRIILKKNNLQQEAYDLIITPDSILISASSGAGIFYGIQTIKNLLPANVWTGVHERLILPCAIIRDSPRFPFRAFLLDVSRNFEPKQEVLKLLDVMALYKLNIFNFHFSDDEGWRLEIPGLAELTDVGAKRAYPFDQDQNLQPSYGSGPTSANKMGSGFYSRKDYIEILKYAATRHILVIPQIESPGHARASIKAMLARYRKYMKLGDEGRATQYLLTDLNDKPGTESNQNYADNVINPALPSSYRFMQKVIDELITMYKEAGAELPMIHMGADEVPAAAWVNSPLIKQLMLKDTMLHSMNDVYHQWFVKIQHLLNERGITLNGAEELAEGTQSADGSRKVTQFPDFIKHDVRLDAWFNVAGNEAVPYQLANAGYKTLLSNIDYFYFDIAYQKSFYEPGDEWLGLLDTKKVLSFIPFDYYRNDITDMPGNRYPAGYFNDKERLTVKGKQSIIGLQGELWGENIKSPKQMEYMLLPRLLALAEKGWAKQPGWEDENDTTRLRHLYDEYWNIFANQLGKYELPRLSAYHGGYNFRIPTAGIKTVNGLVYINEQFPGMEIHYTTDGSEPNRNSPRYLHAVKLKGEVKVKIFDAGGRSGASSSIVSAQ